MLVESVTPSSSGPLIYPEKEGKVKNEQKLKGAVVDPVVRILTAYRLLDLLAHIRNLPSHIDVPIHLPSEHVYFNIKVTQHVLHRLP